MSGGMDIDWDLRDRILANAKKKFEGWTKEQIIARSEALYVRSLSLLQEEDRVAQAKRDLYDEQDEIFAILKEYK